MEPEELVKRYAKTVYNLALRLAGEPADAADIAQDAMLKALRGLPSFRGGDAGAWVRRITINTWKNFLRSRSARRMMRFFSENAEGVDAEPAGVPSPEPGPEAAAETADERRRIEAALEKLSAEERAVLVLRELEGLSYAEIAESLELPLGTVKSRLTRARLALAEALSEVKIDDA